MASPLEQAGATREPSEYAALSMDRGITGLWTQRSPLRDADVPYIVGKFYSASRFDSLIDGLNREITAKLTYKRRSGNSAFNTNLFPAGNSFYSYKRIVNGSEVVRVIYDGQDGAIYDATPGQKSSFYSKGGGGPWGKARFQGVNTALYFTDGMGRNKKWLQPGTWLAQPSLDTTQYAVGTTIIDSNGNLEYLTQVKVGTVTNVALTAKTVSITFSGTGFAIQPGMSFTVPTLGTATFLNGKLLVATSVNGNVVEAFFDHANYASAGDTGSAFTADVGTLATTGGSQPAWPGSYGGVTTDGLSVWVSYGSPVFNLGLAGASKPPGVARLADGGAMTFWQPFTTFAGNQYILDNFGFVECSAGLTPTSGGKYPTFGNSKASPQVTPDGGITWFRSAWLGSTLSVTLNGPQPWAAGVTPLAIEPAGGDVCVDSNGNLQILTAGSGNTGGSAPTWNATYGGTTTDSGLTWTNLGPYLALAFQGRQYGYAFHGVDGSVSTLSPLATSTTGLLDGVTVSGLYSTDAQCDAVWIFHTADGQATPLFIASIPNVYTGSTPGTWSFNDQLSDLNLIAQIAGPQAEANNPPPAGMTAPLFHLGRIWAIYQNTVICSGGPDTVVGNGDTAFPPGNAFPIPEQPIRLFSTVTNAGPAVMVWGRANIYVILGQGTPNSPFQQAALYMAGCGILSYDAVQQIGSTYYAFGNTARIGGNLVGKAFSLDPAAGYTEYGFPIGDQFASVSTGGGGKNPDATVPLGYLYNPANAYVTWAELGSGDTALYLADGAVGWFRYSPVASPESGFLWSPRAVIKNGTSAVQGIETEPGVNQLLIAPSGQLQGNGSVANTTLTWTSGPQFSADMVGKTMTLTTNAGSSTATVNAFIDATHLTLSVSFPPTPAAVAWSVAGNGQILFRDSSTNADWDGSEYQPFESYDVKGCIQLCLSGEVGEIAHVHLISMPQGARPWVGLLFGEILATTAAPFAWYDRTSAEPPTLPASSTLYSDRYSMEQNGVTPKCLFFQLGMDYGVQNVPDETLMFTVYGAKHAERRQQ